MYFNVIICTIYVLNSRYHSKKNILNYGIILSKPFLNTKKDMLLMRRS